MRRDKDGMPVFDDAELAPDAPMRLPGVGSVEIDTAANTLERARIMHNPRSVDEAVAARELREALARESEVGPLARADREVAAATRQERPVNQRIVLLEGLPPSPERDRVLSESLLELAWIYAKQGRFRAAARVCPEGPEYAGHRDWFREHVEAQARSDSDLCACQGESARTTMGVEAGAVKTGLYVENPRTVTAVGPSDTHAGSVYHVRCQICGLFNITPINPLV